jgi:hypothetical protein
MKWEAVGAIANVLAAVGVIATLIYLSVQIRQNNNQLRGAATIAVYDYQRGLTDTLTEDQELYKIALRGNEDLDSLDPWENSASRSGRSKNQNVGDVSSLDETRRAGRNALSRERSVLAGVAQFA